MENKFQEAIVAKSIDMITKSIEQNTPLTPQELEFILYAKKSSTPNTLESLLSQADKIMPLISLFTGGNS